jgi:membrane peptidoglycan carboxypeptidase
MTGGEGPRRRALDARVAARMTAMLASVVTEGTGTRAALPDGRPVAGKTGTTQEARDAWFIGFSAQYVVGVWMGRDDNRPLAGVTGGGLPAAIWRETMARLHRDLPVEPLPAERSAPAPARTRGDETVAEKDEGALRSILRQVVEAIGR